MRPLKDWTHQRHEIRRLPRHILRASLRLVRAHAVHERIRLRESLDSTHFRNEGLRVENGAHRRRLHSEIERLDIYSPLALLENIS